jgi:hypothetical protein
MGEILKASKLILSLFITIFLVQNVYINIPKVVAPIEPLPDQFIAEIFPNCSSPLQLSHTNTLITINATGSSNTISIDFDANYTIFNPENTTKVPLVVLFSLAIDIADLVFEVHANNTQLPYDLFSTTTWDENITAVDIYWLSGWNGLPTFYANPVIFVRSNVTLFKNSTSVMRYQISSPMNNFFDAKGVIYIAYYLGTSQEWIGNNTGRVELRVYGKEPGYIQHEIGTNIISAGNYSYININGGKSLSFEWYNIRLPCGDIGFKYDKIPAPFEIIWEFLLYYILPCIICAFIIIVLVVVIKRRNTIKVDVM